MTRSELRAFKHSEAAFFFKNPKHTITMNNDEDLYRDTESFRDSVSTISEDGKRVFIRPKKPKGKFYTARTKVSIALLILLFGIPFLKFNGEPFMLFNILERKFIVFGIIFWPQDFILFVLASITAIVGVILFTVIYGRIWCGWLCPQTVFLEMVFRKIEYKIEGDYRQQKKLANMPWNAEKMRKKGIKWILFYAISFLIANCFLSYIIGVDELYKIASEPPAEHIGGLFTILIFTTVFFFVFNWFREQACIVVCPYGRLQGVLLDKKSIQVSYDYKRGENRGKFRKNDDRAALNLGDCIDCNLCVAVCPTGIDIRNGSQMECVNCTACMDACDSVMEKVKLPKGLIRYASEEMISEGTKFTFSKRILAYSAVLIALIITLTSFLVIRSEIESTVLRVPGTLYKRDGDTIMNMYNYKILNKSHEHKDLHIELISPEGEIKVIGFESTISLKNQEFSEGTLLIYINKDQLDGRKTKLNIGIYQDENLLEEVKTKFNGPIN